MQNVFVLLLGFPGVGKLTVAQELGSLLPARVIDSHWINNPILGLLDDDGRRPLPDSVWEHTAKIRQAVLDTIATLCDPSANFIFTHAGIQENTRSLASYEQMKDAAERRSALFVPVRLLCTEAELIRRVALPSRRDRLKSIDPEAARRRSRTAVVLDPKHPNSLTFDVTAVSAEETARTIYARLIDRLG
ncbi:chloramphenicol phosphotransferase [Mesorhizobium newzealandense]|uniref:Chloramphenicol phosphotransferase n=1 Tax=Mesorhizobium newzealandense TaxID=1300302 RepID=A0ABW4UFB2_9HYPH